MAPLDVGDRVVDVVQEDLADARALVRLLGHEIDHPPVMGPDTCVAQLVLLRGGRLREQDEAREEGRHGVREDHLGDHAVSLHVGVAALGVPVADAEIGVLQILERVLVLVPPRVELGDVLGIEVLPVLRMAATGVGVGGDDDVAIIG